MFDCLVPVRLGIRNLKVLTNLDAKPDVLQDNVCPFCPGLPDVCPFCPGLPDDCPFCPGLSDDCPLSGFAGRLSILPGFAGQRTTLVLCVKEDGKIRPKTQDDITSVASL